MGDIPFEEESGDAGEEGRLVGTVALSGTRVEGHGQAIPSDGRDGGG